ncbi:hypothetical protein FKP32DRAFT_1431815 [Trametes sanguinea]|nr:hypothetical protein FKP32DRAFT_1431815 [Trametes sanguinea]
MRHQAVSASYVTPRTSLIAAPLVLVVVPGLHPTLSALYNDSASGRSECEPGTRMEALATIFAWILGPKRRDLASTVKPVLDVRHDRPIMWLYALAGAGKSTLAMTTAHWCYKLRILAATFFCGHDGNRSNILAIMPTIACQLARLCRIFREALRKAVAENPNVHQMSVASQVEKLIVEPLCTAIEGGSRAFDGSVIIVDALDECKDSQAVSVVVKSLAIYHRRLTPLKIFVTSRPEAHINAGFVIPELDANTQRFPLTQIPRELTLCDISRFLRVRLESIGRSYNLGIDWPSEDQLTRLVVLSELLFIFASTAALYVEDKRSRNPKAQLDRLLEGKTAAALGSSKSSPLKILDALYNEVLELVLNDLDEEPASQLQLMLGTIALAEERLRPETLEALLDFPSGTAMRLLPLLSSILVLPSHDDGSSPIHLIHLSFADFIIEPSRRTKREFLIAPADQHTMLATHCLRILGTLRHNICEIDPKDQHLLNNEIPNLQERIAQHLPSERQYAVQYWVQHLLHAEVDQDLLGALQSFCDNHLLDWLEALSLMGCVHVAVAALQSAQQLLKKLPLPPTNVVALLYDCERIVRAFYEGISASFFEVLKATATFAPMNSLLRQRHAADLPGMVQLRRGRDTDWSAILTSTDIGGDFILCLDFSPDGRLLACGTPGGSIELRNVQTGTEVHVMKGHEGWVMSASFSPDGKAILFGDNVGSVKLWDVATGACLGTWKRHSNWVRSVAWSSDGTLAASGSDDRTVRLWSVASPEESTELSGHHGGVKSVVFAADGTLLSGSWDYTCKLWDTRTGSLVQTLEHDSMISVLSLSPNSQLVACGLCDGQIALWHKDDGVKLYTIPGPVGVLSLEFSADDTLAAAYGDSSLTLWDVKKRTPLNVLPGRRADVEVAAAFSPDGIHIAVAMGSALNITQWPMDAPSTWRQSVEHAKALSSLETHAAGETLDYDHARVRVLALSVSPDGRRIAAVLTDKVGLLEASTGLFVHTLKHETSPRRLRAPIAWSSTANFAAWGDGDTVCVWDTEPGGCVRTLSGHSYDVRAVHFTPDEQHVLSASRDGTIRRWNVHSEHPSSETLFHCDGKIRALAVSSDGEWMISGSLDKSPPDTSSPDLLAKPSREPYRRFRDYPTLRLLDAAGRVLWIEHVKAMIRPLAFSDECTRAVAGLRDGCILLCDLTQLLPPDTATSHPSTPLPRSGKAPTVPQYELSTESKEYVEQIAFSPDGRGLVSETSYTPLDVGLRPLSSLHRNPSSLPAYFFVDGWLWCFGHATGRQRLCWVPPAFRRDGTQSGRSSSVHGDTIACGSSGQGVVVLNASPCRR